MSLVPSKKFYLYVFLTFIVLVTLFIKDVSIIVLEKYLTQLLETPVKIQSLQLHKLELHGSIKKESNHAYVKVKQVYPLEVDFTYEGNADAFEVYQPVKGLGLVRGTLYYKNSLKIKGDISALGALASVEVKEKEKGWQVFSKVSDLNLSLLVKENKIPFKSSGLVGATIAIDTAKESKIELFSPRVTIKNQVLKNSSFQLFFDDNATVATANFETENIRYKDFWFHYNESTGKFKGRVGLEDIQSKHKLTLKVDGKETKDKVLAKGEIRFIDSLIKVNNIKYNLDNNDFSSQLDINLNNIEKNEYFMKLFNVDVQGSFHADSSVEYKKEKFHIRLDTKSFGGSTQLDYDDKIFKLEAKNLELQKLLYILNKDKLAKGKLNVNASYSKENISLTLQSKLIEIAGKKLEDIRLNTKGKLQNIYSQLSLKTEFGTLENSTLVLQGLKDLSIEANTRTSYISEPIALTAKVLLAKEKVKANIKIHSSEFNILIPDLAYEKDRLKANYTASINPKLSQLNEVLNVKGKLVYKDKFQLKAQSNIFDAKVKAELIGEQLKLNAVGLNVAKILKNLNQKAYLKGKVDVQAKGSVERFNVNVSSAALHFDKNTTGLDEKMAFQLQSHINPTHAVVKVKIKNRLINTQETQVVYSVKDKKLKLNAPITLNSKKRKFQFLLKADADLSKVPKADISLGYKKDSFNLHNLRYENKKIQTDVKCAIEESYEYNDLYGEKLYGPLEFLGKAEYFEDKAYLNVKSSSFSGALNVILKDKDLEIEFKELSAIKIGNFLKGKGSAHSGKLNGNVKYNIENKKGLTHISGRQIQIVGIDIDNTLQSIKDMLGLNLYAVGKTMFKKKYSKEDDLNLTTEISHLQFDVKITPTQIISKDIALATQESRFAVDTKLQYNGDIDDLEIYILDQQGCSIVSQKLSGNISSPSLVDTKVASVIIGQIPANLVDTGGKLIHTGAGIIDSASSFIWKKAFRQDANLTYVKNGLAQGVNIFSSGKDMIVKDECTVVYNGLVIAPNTESETKANAATK